MPRLGAEVDAIVISSLIFIEFNIAMANMTVKKRSYNQKLVLLRS